MKLVTRTFYFLLISLIYSNLAYANEPAFIQVSAEGRVKAQPDQAEFNITFSSTELEAKQARKVIDKQLDQFLKALTDFDLESQSLDTSRARIHPEYDYVNNQRQLRAYRVLRSVNFKLNQLNQMAPLVKLVSNIAIATLDDIRFGISDPSLLRDEALSNAMQSASRTAQLIAEGYNVKLGKIHRVTHHTNNIRQPQHRAMSLQTEMSSDANNSYKQKDIEFKATIDVAFTFK